MVLIINSKKNNGEHHYCHIHQKASQNHLRKIKGNRRIKEGYTFPLHCKLLEE
jgi:hypothetical protein